ncbi:MAG: heparinase II/III family protein [Gemmatimonadales bacterium]
MVTIDDIAARKAQCQSGDLALLLERLGAKAAAVAGRTIVIPDRKAMLSTDGGACPKCRAPLMFDPWSPSRHACSKCETVATGAAHDAHWARAQHLWVAERAAQFAVLAVLTDDKALAGRSRALLGEYFERYFAFPNRDNLLGPTHLFFSTYLESIWLLNYLTAAYLLRERGWLEDTDVEAVNAIADEAANLIGDFNEGHSNRQVWNAAALTAIAVWFGDEELAEIAIRGRFGLLGHLTDGFDDDGMWAEGENYHLFALRGLLVGIDWAKAVGVDLLANQDLGHQLGAALLAPSLTAFADLTFPARRDSRYGVSLAHPAYLECWERGFGLLGEAAPEALGAWLAALYHRPAVQAQTYDAYLHDAAEPARDRTTRADLSWWMLLGMAPELPSSEEPYQPESRLLLSQGVAVLRQHDRYVGIDCGTFAGGHGHPDRLHLTVVAGDTFWLVDPGTGSYVTRDLFWYRSTLAHNAPRLDGRSQESTKARAVAFADQDGWGWISAEHETIRRTIVHGPDWILDVVDLDAPESHRIELPWHLDGAVSIETAGRFEPAELDDEFVTDVARFVPEGTSDVVLTAVAGERTCRLHLVGGSVLRATAPGRPGKERRPFHLVRAEGQRVRLVAVLDFSGAVTRVDVGDVIEIVSCNDRATVRLGAADATVTASGRAIPLGGAVPKPVASRALIAERPVKAQGESIHLDQPPALDGSLDGFDESAPLVMADEAHYYRSEEPYQGEEVFSATAHLNWDPSSLYLAVQVTKADVVVGPAVPKPLGRDNEADDIHLDGIQVYYRAPGGPVHAYLIRPGDDGGVFARPIPGSPAAPVTLAGASTVSDDGYLLTVALPCPDLAHVRVGTQLEFDLVVNEMRPDRVSRAGQLAWGGGHGWIYLRGDRRGEDQWGVIELLA